MPEPLAVRVPVRVRLGDPVELGVSERVMDSLTVGVWLRV